VPPDPATAAIAAGVGLRFVAAVLDPQADQDASLAELVTPALADQIRAASATFRSGLAASGPPPRLIDVRSAVLPTADPGRVSVLISGVLLGPDALDGGAPNDSGVPAGRSGMARGGAAWRLELTRTPGGWRVSAVCT